MAKLVFYIGNTPSHPITVNVISTVSKVTFERFISNLGDENEYYTVWRVLDSNGNGVFGKSVNNYSFVNSTTHADVNSTRLNITNIKSAISEANGYISITFKPIEITRMEEGMIKVVIDGAESFHLQTR